MGAEKPHQGTVSVPSDPHPRFARALKQGDFAQASSANTAYADEVRGAVQGSAQPAHAKIGFKHVATGLTSLPVELLGIICEYCSDVTLVELKDTCSTFKVLLVSAARGHTDTRAEQ
jgi:hypothetical protein